MNPSRPFWFGAFVLALLLHGGVAVVLLQRPALPAAPPKPIAIALAPIPTSDPAQAQSVPEAPTAEPMMANSAPRPAAAKAEIESDPSKKSASKTTAVNARNERPDPVEPEPLPGPEPLAPPAETASAETTSSATKTAMTAGSAATKTETSPPVPEPVDAEIGNPSRRSAVDRGRPELTVSWQSEILAHLARYKRYPRRARARGDTGIVEIRFSVDRGGAVRDSVLHRSSGSPVLDRAALEMIERAAPLPTPPAGIPDDQLTLVVPVRFALR